MFSLQHVTIDQRDGSHFSKFWNNYWTAPRVNLDTQEDLDTQFLNTPQKISFLVTNPLSVCWKEKKVSGILPLWIAGSIGYALSIPRRILGLVKDCFFLIGEIFFLFHSILYYIRLRGRVDSTVILNFLATRVQERFIVIFGDIAEIVNGCIGTALPFVAYRIDEWLHSHHTFNKFSWFTHWISVPGVTVDSSDPVYQEVASIVRRTEPHVRSIATSGLEHLENIILRQVLEKVQQGVASTPLEREGGAIIRNVALVRLRNFLLANLPSGTTISKQGEESVYVNSIPEVEREKFTFVHEGKEVSIDIFEAWINYQAADRASKQAAVRVHRAKESALRRLIDHDLGGESAFVLGNINMELPFMQGMSPERIERIRNERQRLQTQVDGVRAVIIKYDDVLRATYEKYVRSVRGNPRKELLLADKRIELTNEHPRFIAWMRAKTEPYRQEQLKARIPIIEEECAQERREGLHKQALFDLLDNTPLGQVFYRQVQEEFSAGMANLEDAPPFCALIVQKIRNHARAIDESDIRYSFYFKHLLQPQPPTSLCSDIGNAMVRFFWFR